MVDTSNYKINKNSLEKDWFTASKPADSEQ